MTTANDIFAAAMALMDELDDGGVALHAGTEEYARRTPGILNALVAERAILCGEGQSLPVETLEDPLMGVPDQYARGVLHYGLAAELLADENPTAASFYEQRYAELRDRTILRRAAAEGTVEDVYGGMEYGQWGRW